MIADESRTRRIFACLGDPSRFRLIAELAVRNRCVTDLARMVGLSQSCTTRHLQALQKEGLVSGARSGKRVLFSLRLDEPMVAKLVGLAIDQAEIVEDVVHAASSDRPGSGPVRAGRLSEPAEERHAPDPDPSASEEEPALPRIQRRPIEDFLL
jgi:DNA-binding transcriptional ArsR family regulator